MYVKKFIGVLPEEVEREAQLQKRAAAVGLSPVVHRFNKNSITMEHLGEMCIADKYGEQVRMIPKWIREDIVNILWNLYTDLGIQYIDVTPYNFVEKNDRVWVIDFGHAREKTDELDPYLAKMFDAWRLTRWNPRFK